jgi:transposase
VRRSLLRLLKGFQHLFGSRAYGDVFREIHPADRPGGINEKLCRARNIRVVGSCAAMQEIVTANDFRFRIRQKRIGVAKFLSLAPIDIRRVHANRDDLNPARFKFRNPLLETPQLGVA